MPAPSSPYGAGSAGGGNPAGVYTPGNLQMALPQGGAQVQDANGVTYAPTSVQALDGSGARVLANLDNVTLLNVSAAS